MNTNKLLEKIENELDSLNVSPKNLLTAIIGLVDVMKNNQLEDEAIKVLSSCGINLQITEE